MNEKEEYELLKSIYDGAKKYNRWFNKWVYDNTRVDEPDWLIDFKWLLDKKKEEAKSFIKRKEMEI